MRFYSPLLRFELPHPVPTFARFVDVLVHGAGGAAVLRAAEPPRLEQGRGELANTGLVVELAARADGAALHIFAREFAGKARVFSW